MTLTNVLDSYALIAFLENEPGADAVRELILQAEAGKLKLLMCVINLGEVWYSIARTTSPKTADHFVQEIQGMAIEFVDADWSLAQQAAIYKARGKISYADCFVAALAKARNAEVLTGDKEFKMLEDDISVLWL
jgi:ribonuclease VapC